MFHRHDIAIAAAEPADRPGPAHTSGLADPAVPMHACCCPGRPMFKIVMPPTAARPHPVDLWLCGHHYRVSRAAVKSRGAEVYPLATAHDYIVPASTPAGVTH